MFWRFGGYANISTLDTILDKPDVTLEELLDESDLIQELKQHNTKLIEYLRDDNVLRRLLEYVVALPAPKPDDEDDEEEAGEETPSTKTLSPLRLTSPLRRRSKDPKEKSKRQEERDEWEKADKARQKNAYIACEILSSETWSIVEALMESQQHLKMFWDFLRREPPLEPAAAGYFTKINETLLDKKTEETLNFFKKQDGIVPAMLQHVDCPMVMDLLLKIISMEKSEGGMGIVDWLQAQDLIPLLLAYLAKEYPPATQTSAGDFIKAIITISANASQNEQSCIGPNNLTRQLVSESCIETLIKDMLRGGNPLTVGVGTIIEVIRKNNSDYDPDVGAGASSIPSSNDPIYLGTLLRYFAKHVPDFMELILSSTHTVADGDNTMTVKRKELAVAFGSKIEPLGFDRFKTCELMAELLHCSNMGLLNERGSEAFVKQRDQERERLKAEGSLTTSRPPTSAVTEFSEGSAGFANGDSSLGLGPKSPDGTRKLEIANTVDDDGFEDVGNSADLADDIKDDEFEDRTPYEIEAGLPRLADMRKPLVPRLDLDEDFEDEPLSSSPPLNVSFLPGEDLPETMEDLDSPVREHELESASPASDLVSEVKNLDLSKDPLDANKGVSHTSEPHSEQDRNHESSSSAAESEAPPLPQRERLLEPHPADTESPRELSPHPDDKPAPLFAGRAEQAMQEENSALVAQHETSSGNSQETVDTTLGEEGDSQRSVLMSGNETSFAPTTENDVDGQPMAGDFLKMMFVEHKVVPTILDFFFRFPWNNFLHNVVYDVVQQVFNGPMDRGYNRILAIDLFQTGRITERIVEGQQRSDEAQAKNNMRLGYMGHLTLIAEEVVKFSDRHPPELLSQVVLDKVTSKEWSDYVENTLSETRERDNAILGGVRPDMTVGPRQAVLNVIGNAGSNALANAGLNGNTGLDSMDLASNGSGTSTAFGLSSGSLLSGFGSSSDEEDEETEELEENDGSGVGGSDQVGNLSFKDVDYAPHHLPSLAFNPTPSPPTDPPPAPPPLSLHPTRARRQLAHQLALHSAQNQQPQGPQQSPIRSSFLHTTPSDDTAAGKGPLEGVNLFSHRMLSGLASPDEEKDRQDMAGEGEGLVEDEDASLPAEHAGAEAGEAEKTGAQGLEGFANSPGGADEGVGSDEGLEGAGKEEGHEEDLGVMMGGGV